MNVVMIIPTGIGCTIGGHSGDATPVARLLGAACDNLLLHPNVVNASDINEMPENAWYVEGSILDCFLSGLCNLKKPKSNKILAVINEFKASTVNGINAARFSLGIEVDTLILDKPLKMVAGYNSDGSAGGTHENVHEAIQQIKNHKNTYDACAILTPITMDTDIALNYFSFGGVNPYGKIEADVSRLFTSRLSKPVAHAPVDNGEPDDPRLKDLITDGRIASEMIGGHTFSVLKGLSKAPRMSLHGMSFADIDCMVSPMCFGKPHELCHSANIPIIYVLENSTIYDSGYKYKDEATVVSNYHEAAGQLLAIREGIYV